MWRLNGIAYIDLETFGVPSHFSTHNLLWEVPPNNVDEPGVAVLWYKVLSPHPLWTGEVDLCPKPDLSDCLFPYLAPAVERLRNWELLNWLRAVQPGSSMDSCVWISGLPDSSLPGYHFFLEFHEISHRSSNRSHPYSELDSDYSHPKKPTNQTKQT